LIFIHDLIINIKPQRLFRLKTKNGKIGCGWEKTNVFIENF